MNLVQYKVILVFLIANIVDNVFGIVLKTPIPRRVKTDLLTPRPIIHPFRGPRLSEVAGGKSAAVRNLFVTFPCSIARPRTRAMCNTNCLARHRVLRGNCDEGVCICIRIGDRYRPPAGAVGLRFKTVCETKQNRIECARHCLSLRRGFRGMCKEQQCSCVYRGPRRGRYRRLNSPGSPYRGQRRGNRSPGRSRTPQGSRRRGKDPEGLDELQDYLKSPSGKNGKTRPVSPGKSASGRKNTGQQSPYKSGRSNSPKGRKDERDEDDDDDDDERRYPKKQNPANNKATENRYPAENRYPPEDRNPANGRYPPENRYDDEDEYPNDKGGVPQNAPVGNRRRDDDDDDDERPGVTDPYYNQPQQTAGKPMTPGRNGSKSPSSARYQDPADDYEPPYPQNVVPPSPAGRPMNPQQQQQIGDPARPGSSLGQQPQQPYNNQYLPDDRYDDLDDGYGDRYDEDMNDPRYYNNNPRGQQSYPQNQQYDSRSPGRSTSGRY